MVMMRVFFLSAGCHVLANKNVMTLSGAPKVGNR